MVSNYDIGRHCLLNTPTRQTLVDKVTESAITRRLPLVEVAHRCDIFAAETTMRKAFKKEGMHRCVARKKPFLSSTMKEKRFDFAVRHQHLTAEHWRKYLFSDECAVKQGTLQYHQSSSVIIDSEY